MGKTENTRHRILGDTAKTRRAREGDRAIQVRRRMLFACKFFPRIQVAENGAVCAEKIKSRGEKKRYVRKYYRVLT
ncbi:hypothetical protein [Treponema porcinum]|uniref:hypothetical protein n=1 Tax=Treponema porcinum TaxID=261392 RepID=UPI002A80479E|nr:hypothetical protein [Treponema porcinum]